GLEDAAKLVEIGCDSKFFGSPANREVVDKNYPLLQGALRHAAQLSEFQIVQVLHAYPYPAAQHRQHQAQRAARRPEHKKAQHGEERRHAVKDGHPLPLRKSALQKLVMDVLAVSGKYWPATDETPRH